LISLKKRRKLFKAAMLGYEGEKVRRPQKKIHIQELRYL
jgi:hypothetical protein